MGRPVMLGNGSLTVGLNEQGLVHDFYYPYVGLDNLTTARSVHHKIGVWTEDKFSWVDDGSWDISVNFDSNALVSSIRMQSDELQTELLFNDFVDNEMNAFCRQITMTNQADKPRVIRLFMHQVFEISRGGRADTALFVPDESYILDYKGRCSLLIYGQDVNGQVYDQFAIGNYGIEGKEGTFKDAEDGELSGSAVEHGGVDSVIRFNSVLEAHENTEISYWIVAADSQFSAEKLHNQIKKDGLSARLDATREYWKRWLATAANALHETDKEYLELAKKSLLVIKAHIDRRGGIIASCDSSIYNYGRDYYSYVWPRDGAYAIWPLIRLGYTDEPKKFFEFCRDILTPEGYLMHKYQPDRAIGSTWHPMLHGQRKELAIQEDETAVVLYMLGEFYEYAKDEDFVRSLYTTFIQPAANFLSKFTDETTNLPHASYDLWEEKFLTSTYTSAVVYQALLVAAEFAERFEYPDDVVAWTSTADKILGGSDIFFEPERKILRKGFLLQPDSTLSFDNTLDISSLYGVMIYGFHKDDTDYLHDSVAEVERMMNDHTPAGGCPRYENDHYFESSPPFLGNPWFVTTLWLAQYYVRSGQTAKARKYVDWTMQHALPSGMLSEQINPTDGSPLSVTPLVWSHAEFINTVLDLSKVK
ncbi:MAG TPA: glycoside hydrolase family 15 protein [Candidatus Limnocylindrales bacterium]|nr:glycoside hydrolase family 15 protein [Candidatus Limnocylindrales bacterium]